MRNVKKSDNERREGEREEREMLADSEARSLTTRCRGRARKKMASRIGKSGVGGVTTLLFVSEHSTEALEHLTPNKKIAFERGLRGRTKGR